MRQLLHFILLHTRPSPGRRRRRRRRRLSFFSARISLHESTAMRGACATLQLHVDLHFATNCTCLSFWSASGEFDHRHTERLDFLAATKSTGDYLDFVIWLRPSNCEHRNKYSSPPPPLKSSGRPMMASSWLGAAEAIKELDELQTMMRTAACLAKTRHQPANYSFFSLVTTSHKLFVMINLTNEPLASHQHSKLVASQETLLHF